MLGTLLDAANGGSRTLSVGPITLTLTGKGWSGQPGAETQTISATISNAGLVEGPNDGLKVLTDGLGVSNYELPDWVAKAKTVRLGGFEATLEKTSTGPKVAAAGFTLEGLYDWVIVDNLLTVSGLSAIFRVTSPKDAPHQKIVVSVGGTLSFAGAQIAITASCVVAPAASPPPNIDMKALDDADKDFLRRIYGVKIPGWPDFDFQIEGKLDQPIDLQSILRHFGWSGGEQGNPFLALKITRLEMRVASASKSFLFEIDLASTPSFLNGKLELRDLHLSVAGSAGHGIIGALGCTLAVPRANVEIEVQAHCDSADNAWMFEGEVVFNDLGHFGTFVKDTFGDLLPHFNFTIEGSLVGDLAFNTATKDFELSLHAALKLSDGTTTDIRLDVAIAPGNDSSWSLQIGGELSVRAPGGEAMLCRLAVVDGSLIAVYADTGLNKVNIGAIAKRLVDKDLLNKLDIAVPGAVFAIGQKRLVALNLGLDIGAISLPSLPIVPDSAAAGISAHLDVQLGWTYQKVDDSLRSAIAARGFQLMSDIKPNGIAIGDFRLRLGEISQALSSPQLAKEQAAEKLTKRTDDGGALQPVGDSRDTHWLELHRKLGPLRFERAGVGFENTKSNWSVAVAIDAGFEFAGLAVALEGLRMQSPLDKFQPTFGLSGLGVSYRDPAVEIGGALLLTKRENKKDPNKVKIEEIFEGAVIVKGKTFGLSAIGLFSASDTHPTLFIYAILDAALGGPPFFYVTGLAAGFGYNRDILLPEAEAVRNFPLVEWVLPPEGGKPADKPADHHAALTRLEQNLPVSIGGAFAAIGVHFTSFKVLDSFALLIAKFVPRFEIDVLGTSMLVSPPGGVANPVAKATLNLRARFVPDDGILAVRAVLGPDSFVLSRACHLGGGFAFFAWFRDLAKTDEHEPISAGDFVVTLGGYHAAFTPPKHYPAVPRLSVDWSVNEHLSIKGSAYFALTGACLMAGGRFEAAWLSDDVRVAFVAGADFLMTWKPYHYDVTVYVSISADITVRFFGTHHLTLDASADLHLWGPEFSGAMRLHFHVFGCDVPFDATFGHNAAPLAKAIGWDDFRKSFLPEDAKISSFVVEGGLLEEKGDVRIVSRDSLQLAFETTIPLSATMSNGKLVGPPIAPMGLMAGNVSSTIKFHLTFEDSQGHSRDTVKDWVPTIGEAEPLALKVGTLRVSSITKTMPAGIWGVPKTWTSSHNEVYLEAPDVNNNRLVDGMLVGFRFEPNKKEAETFATLSDASAEELPKIVLEIARGTFPKPNVATKQRRDAFRLALGLGRDSIAA